MEDKRISDGALTASTYYNRYLAPWHGRINHRWSWSARRSARGQWLQVYFGVLARLTGISSQGRQDANQWVKSFVLMFSRDGIKFIKYPKVFVNCLGKKIIPRLPFSRTFNRKSKRLDLGYLGLKCIETLTTPKVLVQDLGLRRTDKLYQELCHLSPFATFFHWAPIQFRKLGFCASPRREVDLG